MTFVKKKVLVLTDFDGTICIRDIGNEVINKFTDESWDEINRNYVKGQSDLCPSRSADLIFARGILLKKYHEDGVDCVPFNDFRDICDYLNKNFL